MSTLNLSDQQPNPYQVVADEYALQQRIRGGANWFYWIAVLSLVNSAVYYARHRFFYRGDFRRLRRVRRQTTKLGVHRRNDFIRARRHSRTFVRRVFVRRLSRLRADYDFQRLLGGARIERSRSVGEFSRAAATGKLINQN